MLSESERWDIEAELGHYEHKQAACIEALNPDFSPGSQCRGGMSPWQDQHTTTAPVTPATPSADTRCLANVAEAGQLSKSQALMGHILQQRNCV
jgi:hypothetical protein